MKRAQLEVKDFSSGIISDASPVATPEGVVLRACNFDIQSNGSAHLRPPLRREGSALFSASTGDCRAFVWDAPDGDTGTQVLIAQVGSTLKVLRRSSSVGSAVTDVTPATATAACSITDTATVAGVVTASGAPAKIDVSFVNKYAVVTGVSMTTSDGTFQECVLILSYDKSTQAVTALYDFVWVRDFFGYEDDNAYGVRPQYVLDDNATMYNLFNAGWHNVVDGTFPTKYVIREFCATADLAADTDAICTAFTATAVSGESLPINGVETVAGEWVGDAQPVRITRDITTSTDTVSVTGIGAGGYARTVNVTMVLGAAFGNTSIAFRKVTAVTTVAAQIGTTYQAGLKNKLPSTWDNWALGVYAASSTTREWNPNFLLQAPDAACDAPIGSYIIPFNYRSLPSSSGLLGRGAYLSHVRQAWYDEGWTAAISADRSGRPSKVCAFSGRMWYAFTRAQCSSETTHARSPDVSAYVCFSRIVNKVQDLGACYQRNDPTSPELNDILADDGGFVKLQGAGEVLALRPIHNGVLVFARNGVWHITGNIDNGFSATAYQSLRVSDVGAVAEEAVVPSQNSVLYVARDGLYAVGPGESGYAQTQPLTKGKNDTLLDAVQDIQTIRGSYDSAKRQVQLLCTVSGAYTYEIDVDTDTGAISTRTFVPGSYTIKGLVQYPSHRVQEFSSGEQCPNTGYLLHNGTSLYLGFLRYDDAGGSTYSWADEGGSYASVSEIFVGHVSLGDLASTKTITYLEMFFERTEDTYTVASGAVTVNHESGCYVDSYWEWADTSTSQYKGQQFQAYWYRRPYLAASADGTYSYDYGQSVISTKTKLRGYGKTLALQITPESGKDCKVLGWCYTVGVH